MDELAKLPSTAANLEAYTRVNKSLEAMANIEYYPAVLKNEEVNMEKYTKLPLAKISAIGTAFEPLAASFQKFIDGSGSTASGTSGIYKVTTNGGKLVERADRSGFLGAVSRGSNQVGGGMATLTPFETVSPLVCNPATLFMAATLMSIDKKLDSIQETQKDIFEFLVQKEKSKLRGNLSFLYDVLNNYKHNWNNEKYKNSNHIKALDIKQDSEQSILFYQEQIGKKIKMDSFLHSDKDVSDKLKTIGSEFEEYQLALYLYAFSSFLEVMLLENFGSAYLDGVAKKIGDYVHHYHDLYEECYGLIEGYSKSSIQSRLIGGLASMNKMAGDVVAKIPVVSKSQIDENLLESSSRLKNYRSQRTEKTMEQWVGIQVSAIQVFIENIYTVNRLFNHPMELLFDNENIYIDLPTTSISLK